ncbi:MAG: hypothetical protein J1F38_00055 [Muribaculaceae bacterium]|nr:hypothetical protein [Muribaculaceae bacterium]
MYQIRNHVGDLIKFLPAFLFLLLAFQLVKAQEEYSIPDFAFPQTVVENSDSLLSAELDKGNDVFALRYAMNLIVARNLLSDSQNMSYDINLLDSIGKSMSSDCRRLGFLLEAVILSQAYQQDKENYDRRRLPMDQPFSVATDEWSGEMFKQSILDMINKATCHDLSDNNPSGNLEGEKIKDKNESESIRRFSLLLTDCKTAENIELSINDFIIFKSVRILKSLVSGPSLTLIPFYPTETALSIEGKCENRAKELLNQLINCSEPGKSVVQALACKELVSLLPDYEQEEFLEKSCASLSGEEGEGLLIYEIWNRYGREETAEKTKKIYQTIKNWLEKYPKGFYASNLAYAENLMSSRKIEITLPKTALPSKSFTGNVEMTNLKKGYILIYKLNDSQVTPYDEIILKKFSGTGNPVMVLEVEESASEEVPFASSKEVKIPALSAGIYAVIPSATKSLPKGWNKASFNANYSTIRITDIAILSTFDSNEKDSGKVYVVKAEDQKPVANAFVTYYSGDTKKAKGHLTTNKDGWVHIPTGYYRIEARHGLNVAKKEAGFSFYPENRRENPYASILTDLALYRPGDTVRFAVVGWLQQKEGNSLLKKKKIDISFKDANYSSIGNLSLTLNEEGRAAGEFIIPKGRLLGTYHIIANYPDSQNSIGGTANIQVEEYKLPAFNVFISQEESAEEGSISFKGVVKTYAGMPVTDANVDFDVKYVPWRWGFGFSDASYQSSVTTNSEGIFDISLPLQNLKGTIFERGRYILTAQVTSQAGEVSDSNPITFYLGKETQIRPAINDKIEIDSSILKLNVPVYDISGLPIQDSVEYSLFNLLNPEEVISGSFTSPLLEIPADKLPSGQYKLSFRAAGEKDWVNTESILWRKSDVKAPFPTPLWIPPLQYSYNENQQNIDVEFGTYWPEWILFNVSDGEKVITSKWLEPSDSLIHLNIDIPEGSPYLFVILAGMHDFSAETGQITIVPKKSLEKMTLNSQSFRDKISAGDKEEWTFQFKTDNHDPGYVNAFAVMSDKALNAIYDFKWNLNFYRITPYNRFRINPPYHGRVTSYKSYMVQNKSKYPAYSDPIPDWETYGYSFMPYSIMRINSPVYYKAAAVSTRNMAISDDSVVLTEAAMKEEAVSEDREAAQETGGAETSENQQVELRPVEMPLAFFMPDLKTDQNGLLTLKFVVPNFNTTWQLQIAGYDEELLSSSLLLDAVASKPVMVKTNLPAFLRTGDKASISATLYNNSESPASLEGVLEILNPMSGELIKREKFDPLLVEPSANRIISIQYDVPDSLQAIVVRAYALHDSHSDGEQGLVNVLPSSAPLVESTTFYALSKDESVSVKVPKLPSNANVTLKYCDNPLWEVLLSLPALTQQTNASSLSTALWLYATLTADKIINSNPTISENLHKILLSEDSLLSQSNLEKDANMKITALEATPWLNQASSETARIRSLEKYFDSESIRVQVENKTKNLQKLQKPDGGWTWFEGMTSSPYITSQILGVLGYLNSKQLLSPQLDGMARKGVRYYDAWIIERFKKDKKPDINSLLNYFYSRNLLGYEMNKEISMINSRTLDSIAKEWRHWGIELKAKAGILLLNSDKHKEEGERVAESLNQFVGKMNSLPEEALMLELFHRYDPESVAVESVTQSMFLQKETQDWGNDYYSAGIIYALLENYKDLSSNIERKIPQIFIDGKPIEITPTDSCRQQLSGIITLNLDARKVSGKQLVIKRVAGIPGWGGIVSQYISPIKDVKSSKVENLAIEKRVLQMDSKGKVKEVSAFKKGDKVTIVLNLTVGKDMDYVVIADSRAACLQPDDKISGMTYIDGLWAYREIRYDKTSFFIENLPAGKYVISYECHADRDGSYSLGQADVQCLYSPIETAHSAGRIIKVAQ